MTATVTDLFCGAGGSSLGAEAAGMQLVMAANHWDTAIEVHQQHFPEAGHDCADVSQVDPRRYPATDILIASPECTNHSQARGVSRKKQQPSLLDSPDPAAERSRATMWDVPRFAEQIRYSAIVVENVVEATKWVGWRGWRQVMADLGYESTVLSHNSMHHGVPQSRDRIYVVFWRKGLKPDLELELTAWCPSCETDRTVRQAWKPDRWVGRYRQQWEWHCIDCGTDCDPAAEPAASIIDWTLECPRIGDRTRPLAENTRKRILAGLERYGWVPHVVANNANNVPRSSEDPAPTVTTGNRLALTHPPAYIAPLRRNADLQDVDQPVPTVTAGGNHHALIVRNYGNEGGDPGRHVTPTNEPLRTVTAHPGMALLMRNNGEPGSGWATTPVTEPARTVTSAGHQSLLMPYYGNGQAQPVDRPVPTVPTRDRFALVDVEQLVDDCGFRMLEPHEIAAAMAFPDGYIPDDLTKKDRVKLAGNAVTPPVMAWIAGRLLQALEVAA